MRTLDRLALAAVILLGAGSVGSEAAQKTTAKRAARPLELDERAELLVPREHRIGRQIADRELTYLDGTRGRLAANLGPRGLVIFVRGAECPVSKRYGSETARIEDEFRERGIGFLFVDMEDPSAPELIREEIETFGFEGRYALDPGQVLGQELGATRTTEAYLLDAARTLVYRGAIDDQYGRGVTLAEPRTRFLRQALASLLAGESVRVAATSAPGCVLAPREPIAPDDAPSDEVSPPTYHREVSRILQQNCVECHRKGGAAPFVLDRLDSVRRKAPTIQDVLEQGIMPPWFAAPDTGPWINDRRLKEEERLTLEGWFAADMPEGDPADAPLPRQWKEGWEIGEPDLILSIPEPFEVPAEGVVELQYSLTAEPTPEDMYVGRIQLLPGAVQVVHHVVTYIIEPGKQATYFYGYLPGCGPLVYDDRLARFVPKGTIFRFVIHYTPNGVAVTDRTRMGFVRAPRVPDFLVASRTLKNDELFIPAGADHVVVTDSIELASRVKIRSLTPHMHLRGKSFLFEAFLPDGTTQRLLQLDRWDMDWQFSYDFLEWPTLPRGTRLLVTASYDNSAANLDNPDPTVDVRMGPQTTDEMMMFGLEWVLPNRQR